MKYSNIIEGVFISRPNRFIAYVEIQNKTEKVHVRNTGRCKELLIKGVTVILSESNNEKRKTKYTLIAVYKNNDRKFLVNIDSIAPNIVLYESIKHKKLEDFLDVTSLKREVTYKNSRFDLYFEKDGKKCFAEIKGVTLLKDGVAMFPDAPTARGKKHLNELIEAKKSGYNTYIIFLVQIENIDLFKPNWETDSEFSKTLLKAKEKGVNIIAYNSLLKADEIDIHTKLCKILFT